MDRLNYGRMMQRAMRDLVAEVLRTVADTGLPGEHHFYITFRTDHPTVEMPDWLRERFPDEMVIVLQHSFFDLAVSDDGFSVTLTFNDQPARLAIPFDAILQFADPSAEFGLRFDAATGDDEEVGAEEHDEPQDDASIFTRRADATAERPSDETSGSAEVVQLDTFRKK